MASHVRHLIISILLGVSLFNVGCVSVNIKPKTLKHSTEYKYQAPASIFQKLENDQTDLAWQNQKSGNTIAVLSECSDVRDPSLADLEAETSQALNEPQVLKTQNLNFEDREALRSLIEGKLDGISVKMDVLTFKKNSCSYTLTYMGRSQGFEKDLATFESFIQGFKVP